ncbi:hypothetical protein B8W67_19505 [Mycolicibacillus koreensis]|uniref:HTH cro/C1-type domain-containing protein n=2 Tax=Mycolicibacillus koreensis TaxID=1069220 RepID=A0AA91PB56_9MYCO|nr:hypothetical protein B8W67_19505 [Mycolicibacillus koreensis]
MTAKQLADALGLDPSAYSRVELGKRGLKASELVAAADMLGMSIDDLVHRRDGRAVEAWRQAQSAAVVAAAGVATLAQRLDDLARVQDLPPGLVGELLGDDGVVVHVQSDSEVVESRLRELLALVVVRPAPTRLDEALPAE